jgi:predicted RNA-binding Zn ribbon-like protein
MTPDPTIPPDLALVEAFVNTTDLESGSDEIATPESLTAWLRGRGLAAEDGELGAEDVFRAHALREALRALLFHNNGEELDPAAVATLNEAAAGAPLLATFDGDGRASLVPGRGGLAAVTAGLLGAVARAEADGTWWRLKACGATNCKWAYYDNSRNRSRHWCAMGVCGNRAKARTYRERRRTP